MLYLKYIYSKEKKVLKQIIEMLKRISEMENSALQKFIDELKNVLWFVSYLYKESSRYTDWINNEII